MALNTPFKLRNFVIYEVYVRNHGKTGTFEDVRKDLKRIKSLGTDIVWFMPIHPIGQKNKKGDLGCPYSIKDYRKVNPEYGTIEDFKALVNEIHAEGMLAMIDVVYNHTSRDSHLLENNQEFFYKNSKGEIGNKVGDWSDVCDLDYILGGRALWNELIDTLKYWVALGVDGFRCDVASLVPIEFWMEARYEISKINPNFIWLSETVHPSFILELRKAGHLAQSDSEIYNAFDITYDYDVYDNWKTAVTVPDTLEVYLNKLRAQEYIYPNNFIKLRFMENHDQPRARNLITDERLYKMWTAFTFFQKGAVLIYAGQETHNLYTPSLFDIDKVDWTSLDEDYSSFISRLGTIKKKEILSKGNYEIHHTEDIIYMTYEYSGTILAGVFNINGLSGKLKLDLMDGSYLNLIDDTVVSIQGGEIALCDKAIIIEVKK